MKEKALKSLLAIQAMFGMFGATDTGERTKFQTQIQGVGKAGKQRRNQTNPSPRKTKRGGHRRRYTHGKPWARV